MTKVYLQNSTQKRDDLKTSNERVEFDFKQLYLNAINRDQFDDDGTLKITAGIVEGFFVAGEADNNSWLSP